MNIMMRAQRMLPAIGLAFALALPAGTAMAAPPERFNDHRVGITCALLQTDGADAYFSVFRSDRFGSTAGLQLWLHPDDIITQPPTLVGSEASLTLGAGDATMTGSIDLVPGELGIQSAGTATLAAFLEPDGPIQGTENRFGNSNHKQRETDTFRTLAVSGTLTISVPGRPDVVFGLDGCDGIVSDVTFFATNPASSVIWNDEQRLICTYVSDDLYVGLHAEAAAGIVGADIAVISTTAGGFSNLEGPVTLNHSSFAATFDLVSTGAGLDPATGTAVASATLTALEPISFVLVEQDGRTRITIQPFSIVGSIEIALSDGTTASVPLNDDTCWDNVARSEREMTSASQGGNSRPVANDLPGSAQPVKPGAVISAHTGGAAFEGEAFASCVFEGPFLLNVAHSVWYTAVGTGEPMTIETDGSDFDTVVVAYTASEGVLTEVACNDESDSAQPHQARLTFDTFEGAVYLVQVGGYIDQSGHLRLRVD